ncbi:hypothetical protein [uncultured Roseobacter sp.]|nr:hypothetical protein [uncultured Roseobacter sp.]
MRFLLFLPLVSLFPLSAFADEIVPQDGAWTTQMTEVTLTEACPAETTAAVLPQFEQSLEQPSTREVEFGDRFDPNLLEEGERPYGWAQTGDNTWEGAMLSDGDQKIGIATLTVQSDALISVLGEVELAPMLNPAEDPDFTAMFPPGCSAQMTFQINHDG